ncbi:hypothetical protein BKA61DRAFT_563504 [Leptodontidium sp. MPI-SDFR-AT-0119]|nr:hypothetical protein BKA61DRAFT_563504 [Leptodontidium sp. MPI-SDFR-AT-0119]
MSTSTMTPSPTQALPTVSDVKNGVGAYPLARDFVDFNRLNLQHHIWKDIFGYSLSPKIPRNEKFLKIADVATGTGIWLLDIHSQLPSSTTTELVGFDTDATQVGHKAWLPENLSVRQWSVFDEVPKDLEGTFDIVNVRLIVFVIEEDPVPVLRNLLKLLKPGGHLQWCEIDLESQHIETISPDLPTDCLEAVQNMTLLKDTRLLPLWVRNLERTFNEEGLLNVHADWQTGSRHAAMSMHWCNIPIPMMISDKIRTINPQKAKEIDALIEGCVIESGRGAMWAHNRVIVTGRKPSV